MGIDFKDEHLIFFTLVLLLIGLIFFYKIFARIIRKHFLYESTWFVQKTIFRSYLVFKCSTYTVIISYLIIGIYFSVFTRYLYYGLLLLVLTVSLIIKIIIDKKNGNLKIKETFDFQRYSTHINYYNAQSYAYRRKSYDSVINRITLTNLDDIKNEQLRLFLENNFLPHIQSLITFEFYDARLCNSISDYYTGTLFYFKFYKSLMETISRIKKLTNELEDLEENYKNITDILLNIKLLKFDDNQGLHYDTSLIDLELEKLLGGEEKSLLNINRSIEDLKLALDYTHLASLYSEQVLLLKSFEDKLEEIKAIIASENRYKVCKLPENYTVKDIEIAMVDYYERISKLKLLPKNNSDIRTFVVNRFRNHHNRQSTRSGKKYLDNSFFIENKDIFYKAISSVRKKFGLEKKLLAEIILQEFPNIGHERKTIEGKL